MGVSGFIIWWYILQRPRQTGMIIRAEVSHHVSLRGQTPKRDQSPTSGNFTNTRNQNVHFWKSEGKIWFCHGLEKVISTGPNFNVGPPNGKMVAAE